MKQKLKINSYILFIVIIHNITCQTLNYDFQIKDGKPDLEIIKPMSQKILKSKQIEKKEELKPLSDKEILRQEPMMAPMVELSDMVKDFTSALKHKKKKKNLKLKKKINKPRVTHKAKKLKPKTEYSWDLRPNPKNDIPQPRKAFIGDMGMGSSMALVGGGLAAGALAGGMAMGAASNEKLEKEIQQKENMLGIMIIRKKVDDDLNDELFTTWMKFKGLAEKGRNLLKNGEASLRMIEESMEHMLGSFQAMDRNLYHHLHG
jgi:hypothetical protein